MDCLADSPRSSAHPGECSRTECDGFTLIELVIVIVLIAILAFVVVPRFNHISTFSCRGFADQTKAAVEYARKAAVAQRRNVCVTFGPGVTITRAGQAGASAVCDGPLIDPATGSAFTISPPSGAILTSTASSHSFNGLGSIATSGNVTITASCDSDTYSFTVERETGYVH
jgi:MSHA pilin protein MshC